jgi:peptide/nickel transport system substrate-binding protein
MRFALYVTVAPAWLDPAEASPGFGTPFWIMYGLHDALVKPMPGDRMAPSRILDGEPGPARLRIHPA